MIERETFQKTFDKLHASPEVLTEVLNMAASQDTKIRKFNKKKAVVIVLVACMLCGTTVFAAGKISGYRSWASNLTKEKDITKSRDNARDLGVSLQVPEAFSNGYTFSYSNTGGVEGTDDDGRAIVEGKSFMVTYMKDGEPDVYLNIDPSFEPLKVEEIDVAKDIHGITVYFYENTYKFVPADYELTEEDKINIEKPGYEISYGSSEIQIQECNGFIFEYDNKIYNALSFDSNLTEAEWYSMAEELLAK